MESSYINCMTKAIHFHFFYCMAHIDSDIPNNIFQSAIVDEIIRIALPTLHFSDFLQRNCELLSKILRKGVKKGKCYSSSKKTIIKHQEGFHNFITMLIILCDKSSQNRLFSY